MKTLFIIPARGGSKGIPGKNIKLLGGKPLIAYSIEMARNFVCDEDICISTDSDEIIKVAEKLGLKVPFIRPNELASDSSDTQDVLIHAINWYQEKGIEYDAIVLLQPTSPFRLKSHVEEALKLFDDSIDMVVSVKRIKSNIYSTYYKEASDNFIEKLFSDGNQKIRRQDADAVYELNGSIYIINISSLKEKKVAGFSKIKRIVMQDEYSVDIDEPIDWKLCEFLLEEKIVKTIDG